MSNLYKMTSLFANKYCLYDLADWTNGIAFKDINKQKIGLPIIKIAELNNGITDNTNYTLEKYKESIYLNKGDFVFSWSGNPKTSIDIFKYNLPNGWLNQHIFKVIPNEKIVNKKYFFYLMKYLKPNFISIASNKQTIGLGHVTINDLKLMQVYLPDFRTQEKIADILLSIDDKIELNNKINENLEQQAQAIFNDFIFNSKNLNHIKIEKLITHANTGGDAIRKTPIVDYDTGIRCARVGDLTNNRQLNDWGYSKVTEEDYKRYELQEGDILITRTAVLGLNRFIYKDINAVYNNGLIRIKINKEKVIPYVLYRYLQTKDYKNYISRIKSETSVRPNMKIDYLLNYEIDLLNKEEQKKLFNIIYPIEKNMNANNEENIRLAELRDALLPKLMSGEIDVENLEL